MIECVAVVSFVGKSVVYFFLFLLKKKVCLNFFFKRCNERTQYVTSRFFFVFVSCSTQLFIFILFLFIVIFQVFEINYIVSNEHVQFQRR